MLEHNAESLGYLTGRIHNLLRRRVQSNLDEEGIMLTMDLYPILNNLWVRDNITQQTLTELLGIDRHRVSRMLDTLEVNGWIERLSNPESRREKLIVLTVFGREQESRVHACVERALEEALANLGAERRRTLLRDLGKILRNLS